MIWIGEFCGGYAWAVSDLCGQRGSEELLELGRAVNRALGTTAYDERALRCPYTSSEHYRVPLEHQHATIAAGAHPTDDAGIWEIVKSKEGSIW